MSKKTPSHIDLDKFWPYHVIVLANQISRHTHRVAKAEAGLNLSQWRVLAAVADKPGRTAAQVAMMTPMDKTIVSRAVNSLIKLGVIKKSATPDDKRRFSLSVTTKGNEIYVKISKQLSKQLIRHFLKVVSNKTSLLNLRTLVQNWIKSYKKGENAEAKLMRAKS